MKSKNKTRHVLHGGLRITVALCVILLLISLFACHPSTTPPSVNYPNDSEDEIHWLELPVMQDMLNPALYDDSGTLYCGNHIGLPRYVIEIPGLLLYRQPIDGLGYDMLCYYNLHTEKSGVFCFAEGCEHIDCMAVWYCPENASFDICVTYCDADRGLYFYRRSPETKRPQLVRVDSETYEAEIVLEEMPLLPRFLAFPAVDERLFLGHDGKTLYWYSVRDKELEEQAFEVDIPANVYMLEPSGQYFAVDYDDEISTRPTDVYDAENEVLHELPNGIGLPNCFYGTSSIAFGFEPFEGEGCPDEWVAGQALYHNAVYELQVWSGKQTLLFDGERPLCLVGRLNHDLYVACGELRYNEYDREYSVSFSNDKQLYRISLTDGTMQALGEFPTSIRGYSLFSIHGELYAASPGSLYRLISDESDDVWAWTKIEPHRGPVVMK